MYFCKPSFFLYERKHTYIPCVENNSRKQKEEKKDEKIEFQLIKEASQEINLILLEINFYPYFINWLIFY